MKAFGSLPDGYREICSVDLKKDKKAAVCVNLLAIAIAVILVLPMNAVVPFYRSLVSQTDIKDILIKYVVLLVLMVLYVILHELAHLKVHNHGKNFVAIMDRYMPDWRNMKKMLNEPSFGYLEPHMKNLK